MNSCCLSMPRRREAFRTGGADGPCFHATVGGEATSPTLERLGGIGWQRPKAKAKTRDARMADELLKLCAERKPRSWPRFSARRSLAARIRRCVSLATSHVDQVTAIEDVKTDMEAPVPMDEAHYRRCRLTGRTEVAMRVHSRP